MAGAEVDAPVEIGLEEDEEAKGQAEERRLCEPGRARVVDEGEIAHPAVGAEPLAGEVPQREVAGLPLLETGEVVPLAGRRTTGRAVGDAGREVDVAG